jgi:hypothetical protein
VPSQTAAGHVRGPGYREKPASKRTWKKNFDNDAAGGTESAGWRGETGQNKSDIWF